MSHIGNLDTRFRSLRAMGFTGSMSDMMLQFFQDRGATSNCLIDAQREYLLLNATTPGNVNDMWSQIYTVWGIPAGANLDREAAWWDLQYLGPDLVTNGHFDSNANSWTLTGFTYGSHRVSSVGAGNIIQTIAGLITGRTYRVRYWQNAGGGTVTARINGGTASSGTTTAGYKNKNIVAGATGTTLQLLTTGAIQLDDISCREVL